MRGDGSEHGRIVYRDIEDTGRNGLDPNGVSLGHVLGLYGDQAIMDVPAESARSKGSPG